MAASATAFGLPAPRPGVLKRALIAGSVWGLTFGAVLTGLGAWQCGIFCLSDAAMTTTISVVAGILTMGPLAAFGPRRS